MNERGGALFDTDAASALYLELPSTAQVPDEIALTVDEGRQSFVSAITLGEAFYGVARRKWSARRTTRLRDFYAVRFVVVPVDGEVADEYARLRAATETLGRPIADNDLWIAATATANYLPVVTRNRRHFEPLTLHNLILL